MRAFTNFFINRTLLEMDGVDQLKSQMAAKASEMADSLQKLYPDIAGKIRSLIPQFENGQMDHHQFAAQLKQATGMVNTLGPAFGGNQPQNKPLQSMQPMQKKPLLGKAFGG